MTPTTGAPPGGAASGPARHTLRFAAEAMGATALALPTPRDDAGFAGAASDSRAVTPGRIFFALAGEKVDGFAFCGAAAAAGAAAVVVAAGRGIPAGCDGVAVLAVPDPRRALGDLARAARARFTGRIVGVTGSNGKTTTKELVAAALSASGPVHKTAGNLNSEVGLPLTILEATGAETFWVLEMAMRARGEIAYLAEIARPQVGVVTNVAAAHLGRLGSLEEVARAKGEIFHGLAPGGIGILPAGAPLVEAEAAHLPEARKLRFGAVHADVTDARREEADVRILEFVPAGAAGAVVRLSVKDSPVVVRLPLAGAHNARNAAAALAVVAALGLPIGPAAAALARTALPPHRSRVVEVAGRSILDDCYNANPASMSAALATVAGSIAQPARAWAILGDMLELGDEAEALHVALGRELVARRFAGVVAVGPLAAHIARGARQAGLEAGRVVTAAEPAQAAAVVAGWAERGDWIVVKGSRGGRLERAVEALERAFSDGGGATPASGS